MWLGKAHLEKKSRLNVLELVAKLLCNFYLSAIIKWSIDILPKKVEKVIAKEDRDMYF